MKIKARSLIPVLALGGLLACGVASAQDAKEKEGKAPGGRRQPPSAEQRLERMTEALSLTDEQKPKVKAVLEDSSKKMGELSGLSGDERREKMTAIREEESKKLKGILTEEQFKKYQDMPRGGAGRGGAGKKEGDTKKE